MNRLRLLTLLLCAGVAGSGTRVCGQTVMTLEEVFESAEANSAQLRPYLTAEHEARQEIAVARSERLPKIEAALNLSFIGDGFTTARDFSDCQKAPIPHFGNGVSIAVEQPLYTGGAITAGIRLAEQKSTAARFAADLQRDNLRMQLAGFYLDIYKCRNQQKVVENNLAQARQVLAEMHARHEQGTVLRNDITRYELLVSNLELQLIKLSNTLEILNENLVTLASLAPGTTVVPDSAILARSLPDRNESQWRQEALESSLALALARSEMDISRTAHRLTESERLPKIGLKAAWTLDGPILVEVPPINRNLSYWYVGIGVSYNLSSLYTTNKSLEKSRLSMRRAAEQLEAARENVDLGIHSAHVRYMESYEELRTQEKSVELAKRNYATISTRYSEDMALITDMLDAANSQLEAEQRLVNARIDIIYNYYRLLFTSGKI